MRIGKTTRLQDLCPSLVAGITERNPLDVPSRRTINDLFPGTHLHDSLVVSVERTAHDLTIVLDDIQTLNFASHILLLCETSVEPSHFHFPVALAFRGIKEAWLNRVNRNHKALPLSWNRYAGSLREYSYDEVISTSDELTELGVAFWSNSNRGDLVLLAAAVEFRVEDEQVRASFDRAFGGRFGDLFDRYWESRRTGEYLAWHKSQQLVEEYLRTGA